MTAHDVRAVGSESGTNVKQSGKRQFKSWAIQLTKLRVHYPPEPRTLRLSSELGGSHDPFLIHLCWPYFDLLGM